MTRDADLTDIMQIETNASSLAFVEQLYADFLRDPGAVSDEWREFFERMHSTVGNGGLPMEPKARARSIFHAAPGVRDGSPEHEDVAVLQRLVEQLIRNYRVRGHIVAQVDPLGRPRPEPPELDPAYFGITEADLDRRVSIESPGGRDTRTVCEVYQRMRNTYCRYVGAQFMHIDDLHVREWLQRRMESTENRIELGRSEQLRILTRLTDAVIFEEFLQKKYVGAKSFSLEGAETLIPLLGTAIERAASLGFDEVVMGMPHRGRLNVLANILGKSPQLIFREFEDLDPSLYIGGGDVKYHLGHTLRDYRTPEGRLIQVGLAFNPSHLEYVDPLVLGRGRAKQDRIGDAHHTRVLTMMIHGDAAFAGEGVVQETLNLSELAGYSTGGTLHVIINNQLGFTTPPEQGRSSVYATDVAKMLQIPIFHVNGERPEAVAQVVHLALDFRTTFQRDVVIDMYCYRRRGHNEGDEPSFTQPLMYEAINKRESVRDAYLSHLLELGGVTREEADRIADQRRQRLERELSVARSETYMRPDEEMTGVWEGYFGGPEAGVEEVATGVPKERLMKLLRRLTVVPEGFHLNPKLERPMQQRRQMAEGKRPLDWSAAEALAFASLATEGLRVRLAGQDSERGTFSQRHAVLHDTKTGQRYCPLEHLTAGQAPVTIMNSTLSEAAALGFEYGYSLAMPDALVAWEAQFGDFANAAQVIIDQFITSAEDKWHRYSGLVLLLPHGFEGQGPEHSSARLERFLTLAAEDNIQVVQPTTPAQYFHVLRRQVIRPWRKPLVVLTPKSLLRHPACVSSLEELATGGFQRVLAEPPKGRAAGRVMLCTGKIYYELVQERERLGRDDVAIVRVEQLYPFPIEQLRAAVAPYADGTPVVWVQDEPRNMGAWPFLAQRFGGQLFERLPLTAATRAESASPATGSAAAHRIEQKQLITQAFGGA